MGIPSAAEKVQMVVARTSRGLPEREAGAVIAQCVQSRDLREWRKFEMSCDFPVQIYGRRLNKADVRVNELRTIPCLSAKGLEMEKENGPIGGLVTSRYDSQTTVNTRRHRQKKQ